MNMEHAPLEDYILLDEKTAWSRLRMPLHQAIAFVVAGKRLGIKVDRWKEPWPVEFAGGYLWAKCPTSRVVRCRLVRDAEEREA